MPINIEFSKIRNQDIFCSDFENLTSLGTGNIEFGRIRGSTGGLAVLYAPNGTGKSSLANVLKSNVSGTSLDFEAHDSMGTYSPSNNCFHVIGDQISRNIIPGETSDYLIGQNIRREYELRSQIDSGFTSAYKTYQQCIKDSFGITKVGNPFLEYIKSIDEFAFNCIKDIINRSSNGKGINRNQFIEYITTPHEYPMALPISDSKRAFITNDFSGEKIIHSILSSGLNITTRNDRVAEIEQNDDAIAISRKYPSVRCCIVCDSPNYSSDEIIRRKSLTATRLFAFYTLFYRKVKRFFIRNNLFRA